MPRIKEPTYIDARPPEVEGRAVPGHWEGDLVVGKNGKTALVRLVERTSRFVVLCPLTGRDSPTVTQAVIAAVGDLPAGVRRSLTWDCGSELALHADVTATGLPVYFAHPHSPWERGSNENANRIIREFFPKGTDSPPTPPTWPPSPPRSMTALVGSSTGRNPPRNSPNYSPVLRPPDLGIY